MSPQCTADAAFVESVAKLINNENDSFVAAYSGTHHDKMALKSWSFSLVRGFALSVRCRVTFSIPSVFGRVAPRWVARFVGVHQSHLPSRSGSFNFQVLFSL